MGFLSVLFLLSFESVQAYQIHTLELGHSNVFLVQGQKNILIDTGSPGEIEKLIKKLSEISIKLENLDLVILTHAHAEHSGNVTEIKRRSNAKVLLQRAEIPVATAGDQGRLKANAFLGYILRWFVTSKFEPFTADIIYDSLFDLFPWGVGGSVNALPGHSPGSSVVIVDQKNAFVGDMMMGGIFNGTFFATQPGEYYFQDNSEENRRNIKNLVDMGIETFYLGHGGPVTRAAVQHCFQ